MRNPPLLNTSNQTDEADERMTLPSTPSTPQMDLERKSTPETYNEALTLLMYFAEGVRHVTRKLKHFTSSSTNGSSDSDTSITACDHNLLVEDNFYQYYDSEEDIYVVLKGTVFDDDLQALDIAVTNLQSHLQTANHNVVKALEESKIAQQEATESRQSVQDAYEKAMEIRYEVDAVRKENDDLRQQLHAVEDEKHALQQQIEYLKMKAQVAKRQSKRRQLEQHIMEALVIHERHLAASKQQQQRKGRESKAERNTSDTTCSQDNELDEFQQLSMSEALSSNSFDLQSPISFSEEEEEEEITEDHEEMDENQSKYREHQIQLPSGKLGILIKDLEDGPTICNIDSSSSVKDILKMGDIVRAVDDVDVSQLGAFDIVDILTQKAESDDRIITVLRPDDNTTATTTGPASWISKKNIKLLNSSIRKIGEEVSDVMQASVARRSRDRHLLGLEGLGSVQALDPVDPVVDDDNNDDEESNSRSNIVLGSGRGGTLKLLASTLEACKELKKEALLNLDDYITNSNDEVSDSDASSTCSFTSLSSLSDREGGSPHHHHHVESDFTIQPSCKGEDGPESSLEPDVYRTLSYSSDEE